MGDAVADRGAIATSLNRSSWAPVEEEKRNTDTTPLLRRQQGREKKKAALHTSDREQHGGGEAVGREESASYSAIIESDGGRRSLFVTRTMFGEVRNCRRFSVLEWFFVVVATVTMAGIAAMSVERFVFIHRTFGNLTPNFNDSMGSGLEFGYESGESGEGSGDSKGILCSHWSCLNDFTFALLISANWIFCVYYCYDGLLRERPFEIMGYAFTIFIVFTDVVVNFFVEGEQGDIIKLIRLIVAFILGPVNIVLALVVQHYMGFLVLNTIGTNQHLTKAYHRRSLFLTVQTFNIQVLVNILVLSWVKGGHFTGLGEKVVLPILIVYTITVSYLGWAAVMWEIRSLAMVWIVLASFSFGYYFFKIVNVAVHWSYYREVYTEYYIDGQTSPRTHFLYIAVVILFSCFLGVIVGVALTVLMVTVLGKFGHGLKERIPPPCSAGTSKEPDQT